MGWLVVVVLGVVALVEAVAAMQPDLGLCCKAAAWPCSTQAVEVQATQEGVPQIVVSICSILWPHFFGLWPRLLRSTVRHDPLARTSLPQQLLPPRASKDPQIPNLFRRLNGTDKCFSPWSRLPGAASSGILAFCCHQFPVAHRHQRKSLCLHPHPYYHRRLQLLVEPKKTQEG